MIVVTGGCGFIGSNLVHALNSRGRTDVIVVDDLRDGKKFINLAGATFADYYDHQEFLSHFDRLAGEGKGIEAVYHLGACSDTMEWDGQLMMAMNFQFSRELLNACDRYGIPFIYASSASVYGLNEFCSEAPEYERPLNVYAFSKLAFDQHVRQRMATLRSRIVGLRYFNVYGPREQHKGRMASVMYHFNAQLAAGGSVRLFGASHGVAAGEQERDFVYVDDVVEQTLWFGEHPTAAGIFNCGTGRTARFNEVAEAVIAWHGKGAISYVPFPPELLPAYQNRTCADLGRVRAAGFTHEFHDIKAGVGAYLDWLQG